MMRHLLVRLQERDSLAQAEAKAVETAVTTVVLGAPTEVLGALAVPRVVVEEQEGRCTGSMDRMTPCYWQS
jgi:hypothetical protein